MSCWQKWLYELQNPTEEYIKTSKVSFLLGLLHVNPVRQAYNHSCDKEADYNSNHQLGLVSVFRRVCKRKKKKKRDVRDPKRIPLQKRNPDACGKSKQY